MNKEQFYAMDEKQRLGRTLEGISYYASIHSPNMTSVKKFKGTPYFIVNLGLDKENQEKAKSYGLEVFEPEGEIKQPYVKIKRKVNPPKTSDDVKPEVVDTAQNPIPSTILVGNGSKVRVKFATYWYDTNGGGVGTALYKVQVVDLIEFKPSDRDFVSDGSGFKVSNSTSTPSAEKEFKADDLPWEEDDSATEEQEAPKPRKVATKGLFD